MSSGSRALASARSKRAGEAAQPPPAPIQTRNSNSSAIVNGQPEPGTKLSVSDAFALTTIRLSRLEMMFQKMNIESLGERIAEHEENVRIVDQQVFSSMTSRLDKLEKTVTTTAAAPAQQAPTMKSLSIQEVEEKVEQKTRDLIANIRTLQDELRSNKDMIYKLQSTIMDTNQKLVDLVLQKPATPVTPVTPVAPVVAELPVELPVEVASTEPTALSVDTPALDVSADVQVVVEQSSV